MVGMRIMKLLTPSPRWGGRMTKRERDDFDGSGMNERIFGMLGTQGSIKMNGYALRVGLGGLLMRLALSLVGEAGWHLFLVCQSM